MIVYMLYYDTNSGDREEWNTFYTPGEAFVSDSDRKERIKHIKTLTSEYEFHEVDIPILSDPYADVELDT